MEMTLEYFEYSPAASLRCNPDWGGLYLSRGLGRHPNRRLPSYEIIFVRAGTLEIQEEEKNFVVRAGETLLLRANRRHWGTADNLPGQEYFWVHFEYTPAEYTPAEYTPTGPLPAAYSPAGADAVDIVRVPQHTKVENPQFLELLFRHFLNEHEAKSLNPVAASLLVSLMLCEIARPPQSEGRSSAAAALAARADVYIHRHCHEPLTTATVADALLCNPSYLSRVYRRRYDRTVTEAINHYRMDYAQDLIVGTSQSVGEVARTCGIPDTSYFLKLFKQRTGMTALAYRRLHTLKNIRTG